MKSTVTQLSEGIWQVGAADPDCTRFHGYYIHRGTTYNAYLVRGENNKFTLIDTVRDSKATELIANIEQITPLSEIEAIIVNHTEPDHSGALPVVLKNCSPRLFATAAAAKLLKAQYGIENVTPVKAGQSEIIGGREYAFYPTPMVHWPDNMVTFLKKEKLLFSNDAFGQHYAANALTDADADYTVALQEARHYFANIVMPFRAQAKNAVDAALSLSPKTVAPSHGVVWTKHLPDIVKLYKELCDKPQAEVCTLAFDSMWGGCAEEAAKKKKELRETFKEVHVFDLRKDHISDVIDALSVSAHLCLGSPTHYLHPTARIATLLAEIETLKPPFTTFSLFGTYGWGGGAVKCMKEKLESFGYNENR